MGTRTVDVKIADGKRRATKTVTETVTETVTDTAVPRGAFGHERLTVYRLAVEFYGIALKLANEITRRNTPLAEQLRRAAASVTLNVAEGAGEFSRKEKARFYRMALRSATECAAVLDLAALGRDGTLEWPAEARSTLHQIVALLTTMVLNANPGPSRRRPDEKQAEHRRSDKA